MRGKKSFYFKTITPPSFGGGRVALNAGGGEQPALLPPCKSSVTTLTGGALWIGMFIHKKIYFPTITDIFNFPDDIR